QVYDMGFANGYWYIAMEYVDGPTLAEVWLRVCQLGRPMPLGVAIGIVLQLCEALHHVHERTDRTGKPLGIVHQDVTPYNVMLTRDGVVKLVDFGVATTAFHRREELGVTRGTLAYMSPEQVRARPLDRRSDIFSLGVILYELTTNVRLFDGDNIGIMRRIVEQDVPPPSSVIAGYPKDLEALVLSVLQRERSRRLQSMVQFARNLETISFNHSLLTGYRTIASYVSQLFPHQSDRWKQEVTCQEERDGHGESGFSIVNDEEMVRELALLHPGSVGKDDAFADPLVFPPSRSRQEGDHLAGDSQVSDESDKKKEEMKVYGKARTGIGYCCRY
ncbi:MAG: serine/threonine-protein kinase, partial [Sandaracinaceae bacterium]|nr:serine/threonine-protein kinase [Sandaracinaceae bacterium]